MADYTLQVGITDTDGVLTFSKTGGTATNATVASDGDINLQQVAGSVEITWSFSATGPTFSNAGVTFTGAGNSSVFGSKSRSPDGKSYTATDANASGASSNNFSYTVHESATDDDPQIWNRN